MADTMSADLLPDIIARYKDSHKTDILVASSGHEQRLNRWYASKRMWRFTWLSTQAIHTSLNTFFNNQGGMFKKWLITDSRIGTLVSVRFDSDDFEVTPIKWKMFRIEIDVIEDF